MTTYGMTIKWTHWGEGTQSVTVDDCASWEEAHRKTVAFAEESGWTQPRWWQFWRWNDTRVDFDELNETA